MTTTLPVSTAAGVDWRDSALCAQTDPDLWFPEIGGPAREAKQVCRRCPVTAECLADVMRWSTSEDRSGVRGGLSAKEREQLRARPQ